MFQTEKWLPQPPCYLLLKNKDEWEVGEQDLLIGVFGCPESNTRFADTLLLFTQAFDLEIPEPVEETQQAA